MNNDENKKLIIDINTKLWLYRSRRDNAITERKVTCVHDECLYRTGEIHINNIFYIILYVY